MFQPKYTEICDYFDSECLKAGVVFYDVDLLINVSKTDYFLACNSRNYHQNRAIVSNTAHTLIVVYFYPEYGSFNTNIHFVSSHCTSLKINTCVFNIPCVFADNKNCQGLKQLPYFQLSCLKSTGDNPCIFAGKFPSSLVDLQNMNCMIIQLNHNANKFTMLPRGLLLYSLMSFPAFSISSCYIKNLYHLLYHKKHSTLTFKAPCQATII